MTRIAPALAFFAVALCLVGGMHYYVWARLVRDPQLPVVATRALTSAVIALALAAPATFIASRAIPEAALRPLLWLAFLWMGISFLLAALLGFADAGRAAAWIVHRLRGPDLPPDPQRRLLLVRALALSVGGAALGLTALGMRAALGAIQVKRIPVKIAGLPPDLAGFRIVQITDLHVGPLLGREWVEGVVERVNALAPDLVAITGDLVDGRVRELREKIAPLLQIVAPRGVFFVTGNHEYYSGADEWLRHLPKLGVRPLHNERIEVAPGLDLAGVPDYSARFRGNGLGPDLERALAGRDPAKPLVLLAHQPRQFTEAARKGVELTLSGHTHGGQIWPFGWIVALAQPYIAGLHREGGSQLYVSRGTGFWGPPMRVFAPAEITLLTLQPA